MHLRTPLTVCGASVVRTQGYLKFAIDPWPEHAQRLKREQAMVASKARVRAGLAQGWAALVPVGISCWLLAIVPTNPTSTRGALVGGIVFFVFFALVGLGAVSFWGLLTIWVAGLVMGVLRSHRGSGARVLGALVTSWPLYWRQKRESGEGTFEESRSASGCIDGCWRCMVYI